MQCHLQMDHPTVWKFIDGLRTIQKGRDDYYEHLVAGNAPATKLRKYQEADLRIRRIVRDYGHRTTLEYLRGIAHNFEMNHKPVISSAPLLRVLDCYMFWYSLALHD